MTQQRIRRNCQSNDNDDMIHPIVPPSPQQHQLLYPTSRLYSKSPRYRCLRTPFHGCHGKTTTTVHSICIISIIITTVILMMIIMMTMSDDGNTNHWFVGNDWNSYLPLRVNTDTTTTTPRDSDNIQMSIRHSLLDLPDISAEYVWDQLLIEASFSVSSSSSSSTSRHRDNTTIIVMEVGMHTARQCIQAARLGLIVHCVEPSPKSFARVQSSVATFLSSQEEEQEEELNPEEEGKEEAPSHGTRSHSHPSHHHHYPHSMIHLYNRAASSESGHDLPFVGAGSTGDHVGDYDMWNMQPGPPVDPALLAKQGTTILVPTIRLDDIIANVTTTTNKRTATTSSSLSSSVSPFVQTDPSIYLIKVDTQGYEPFVLQGLSHSFATKQVQFVLMEYWPRGMDLISSSSSNSRSSNSNDANNDRTKNDHTKSNACTASTEVLRQLVQYGYTLYALPPSTHPRAPIGAQQYIKENYFRRRDITEKEVVDTATLLPSNHTSTTTSITSFCQWFYQVEELYPSSEYKMGYWADILAVAGIAPDTTHIDPTTSSSFRLHTDLMKRIVQDQHTGRTR